MRHITAAAHVVLDLRKLKAYSAAFGSWKLRLYVCWGQPDTHTDAQTRLQIEYAALDAVCLLMLLDNFMACAPAHLSSQTPTPAAEPRTAAVQTRRTAVASADCTVLSCSDADKASGNGDVDDDADSDDACADACLTASSTGSRQHPPRDEPHSGALGAPGAQPTAALAAAHGQQASKAPQQLCLEQSEEHDQSEHQAAVRQAMAHWACRLEMSSAGKGSKPRAKRHLSRRQRAHNRHAMEQQNQIDEAAGQPLWLSVPHRNVFADYNQVLTWQA